jgi:hypothetical protein
MGIPTGFKATRVRVPLWIGHVVRSNSRWLNTMKRD